MVHPFGALKNIHALMPFNTGLVVFRWEWENIHQTQLFKRHGLDFSKSKTMDKCLRYWCCLMNMNNTRVNKQIFLWTLEKCDVNLEII